MAKTYWRIVHDGDSLPMLRLVPDQRVFRIQEYIEGKWCNVRDNIDIDIYRQVVKSDERTEALQLLRQFIVDGLAVGYIAFPPALDPPSLALRQIDAVLNAQPEPQAEVPYEVGDKRGNKHARELFQEFINLNDEQSNIPTTQLVLKYHKLIEKARTWMALFPKKGDRT